MMREDRTEAGGDAVGMLSDFTIGAVIRRTLRIAGSRFWTFFAVALALVELPKWGGPVLLAPAIADVGAAERAGAASKAGAFAQAFALGAAPGLVAQLGAIVLTGMVVRAALGDATGRPVPSTACLRTGLAAFPGNLALTVLYYASFSVGLALLVVPGLILSCMWAVITPAYVAERGPVLSALGRSRALTKGHRWAIFGLTLVYGLVVGACLGFLSGFAAGLAGHSGTQALVASVEVGAALVGGAVAVVSASGVTALYMELRRSREGLGEDLAEAFA